MAETQSLGPYHRESPQGWGTSVDFRKARPGQTEQELVSECPSTGDEHVLTRHLLRPSQMSRKVGFLIPILHMRPLRLRVGK